MFRSQTWCKNDARRSLQLRILCSYSSCSSQPHVSSSFSLVLCRSQLIAFRTPQLFHRVCSSQLYRSGTSPRRYQSRSPFNHNGNRNRRSRLDGHQFLRLSGASRMRKMGMATRHYRFHPSRCLRRSTPRSCYLVQR